jgi:hypothetical protein
MKGQTSHFLDAFFWRSFSVLKSQNLLAKIEPIPCLQYLDDMEGTIFQHSHFKQTNYFAFVDMFTILLYTTLTNATLVFEKLYKPFFLKGHTCTK